MTRRAPALFVCVLLAGSLRAQDLEVIPLDGPDFKSDPPAKFAAKPAVSLKLISSKANDITDTKEWFAKNSLLLNEYTNDVPTALPSEINGEPLLKTIRSGGRYLGIYGEDYASGRYVVAASDDGNVEYALDFNKYRQAPRNVHSDIDYVKQRVVWAEQQGDVLYVSHGHNTYAKSSYGMNAYISAIDVKSGRPLWHSAPLVSNSNNFAILGDSHLVTGYGFTAEPDYLYILNLKDGSVINRQTVKSGPEYLIPYDGKLYVRTYNTDYVFGIAGKP